MKSIIHEASSLAKAIEQGWIKAGKPQEFSVKVFEVEKTNFFGFVTQKAKVGIFFKESEKDSNKASRKPSNNEKTVASKNITKTPESTEKKTYPQRRRRRRTTTSNTNTPAAEKKAVKTTEKSN